MVLWIVDITHLAGTFTIQFKLILDYHVNERNLKRPNLSVFAKETIHIISL